jgi:NitT/TauT family transport system substrate-binding protein
LEELMRVSKIFGIIPALAAILMFAAPASAQAPEKKDLVLGVGGKGLLYYLPLTLAERLGYFKEQGLNVTINDFAGGAQSLQSLVGGSVDVVAGAYEHTIRMQAKGQDIKAVIELGRFPGIVLGVKTDKATNVKSFADLKGMKIGVTAPGSSTNFFAMYLMVKAGLKRDDAAFIRVGASLTAVAAMQKGEIDAISNLDPVITKLEQDKLIVVLADSRTEEGNQKLFGGNNPAAVVYLKTDFIQKNPETTQRIVNAFYKALKWLEKASAEDVVKTVPEEFYLGDRNLYISAFKASAPMYSKSGIIPEQGMKNANEMLILFDQEVADAKVDLRKTFDDRFVRKAAGAL